MCFSFEISLLTFLSSWSISIYLLNKRLNKKNKNLVIALMIFSSIQIIDAIFWYTGMKKDNINYYLTSFFVPLILSLQILFNVFIINNNKNYIISIVSIFVCIYLFFRFNGYTKALCNNRFSSPIWGSNEISLLELISFAFLIFYPRWNDILFTILFMFPLIYFIANGAYGSLWCSLANIYAFYYLFTF